jgi:hypothetical protein
LCTLYFFLRVLSTILCLCVIFSFCHCNVCLLIYDLWYFAIFKTFFIVFSYWWCMLSLLSLLNKNDVMFACQLVEHVFTSKDEHKRTQDYTSSQTCTEYPKFKDVYRVPKFEDKHRITKLEDEYKVHNSEGEHRTCINGITSVSMICWLILELFQQCGFLLFFILILFI